MPPTGPRATPPWPKGRSVPDRRRLSAAEGVQAACILFALNTDGEAVLRMLAGCGFPAGLLQGESGGRMCEEWRAFVHAAVTASLMQHAPTAVVLAYLRQTRQLLGRADRPFPQTPAPAEPSPADGVSAQTLENFVDGPFSAYMPLLAQAEPQTCPSLFYRRTGADLPQAEALAVQARLAAVMALLISTLNDKLDAYDISAE